MDSEAAELARRLGREAEAVCRHYLSNGRQRGGYWIVGDTDNTPGRSLYVRLAGSGAGPGAAGKWTDAATGEHGDLLDLIAANLRLTSVGDVLAEARRFLGLPKPDHSPRRSIARSGSPEAAQRLFAMAGPIVGTLADVYLRGRGIAVQGEMSALRFHPRCYYWRDDHAPDEPPEVWPALLARVSDIGGRLTGVHRTWLDPSGEGKAPVDQPRKAMGRLLGHGVRIGVARDARRGFARDARNGVARDALAAGEGIETMLSLTTALPDLPVVAALSANHLAALVLPLGLERLYIAMDADDAGETAAARLSDRAEAAGIEAIRLGPRREDFNEDLRAFGTERLRAHLRPQLAPADVARLLHVSGVPVGEH
jgi:hypothetical protein